VGKKVQTKFQRNFSSFSAQFEFGFRLFMCAFYIDHSKGFINNGIVVEKKPFIVKGSNIIAMYPSHIV